MNGNLTPVPHEDSVQLFGSYNADTDAKSSPEPSTFLSDHQLSHYVQQFMYLLVQLHHVHKDFMILLLGLYQLDVHIFHMIISLKVLLIDLKYLLKLFSLSSSQNCHNMNQFPSEPKISTHKANTFHSASSTKTILNPRPCMTQTQYIENTQNFGFITTQPSSYLYPILPLIPT